MNNILINYDKLKHYHISLQEFLELYRIYSKLQNNEDIIDEKIDLLINYKHLEHHKYIKIIEEDDSIILREAGKMLIEDFMVIDINDIIRESKKTKILDNKTLNNVVDSYIKDYRNKWKNLKAGSMGSPKACKEKLIRWLKENPEYDMDQVMKAADLYIKTEGRNKNYAYLQRADYFIFKKDGKDEVSRLSAFIEEIDIEQEEDWTLNVK